MMPKHFVAGLGLCLALLNPSSLRACDGSQGVKCPKKPGSCSKHSSEMSAMSKSLYVLSPETRAHLLDEFYGRLRPEAKSLAKETSIRQEFERAQRRAQAQTMTQKNQYLAQRLKEERENIARRIKQLMSPHMISLEGFKYKCTLKTDLQADARPKNWWHLKTEYLCYTRSVKDVCEATFHMYSNLGFRGGDYSIYSDRNPQCYRQVPEANKGAQDLPFTINGMRGWPR